MPINTSKYGPVDVNFPLGALQVFRPALASKLANSTAQEIMQDPLLSFIVTAIPMDRWQYILDKAGQYRAIRR